MRRAALLIGLFLLALFGLAFLVLGLGYSQPWGQDPRSRSALGLMAFYKTLSSHPDFRGRVFIGPPDPGSDKARNPAVLVLGEPEYFFHILGSGSQADQAMAQAAKLLVILPKWRAREESFLKPGWVKDVSLSPGYDVLEAQPDQDFFDSVSRTGLIPSYGIGRFAFKPDLGPNLLQLVSGKNLCPILYSPEGTLLGRSLFGDIPAWILSDPDILANHGLDRGENLDFAIYLAKALLDDDSVLIFHSYHGELSLTGADSGYFSRIFSFPWGIVTLLVLSLAVMAFVFGLRRYWPLEEEFSEYTEFGKKKLIANSARLLTRGRHGPKLLEEYALMAINQCARIHKAPKDLSFDDTLAFLDRLAASRGSGISRISKLWAETRRAAKSRALAAEERPILETAKKLYVWKRRMESGS
jgi:hypothetical protein